MSRLKEMAMGMELAERHLVWKALDTIENQNREIEGLMAMLEQANGQVERMQMRADAAWETNRTLMQSVSTISEERDALHKRVVFLESQYARVLNDFQRSLLGEPCDYCGNRLLSEENCIEANCDCEKCGHTECVCHDCRDCDKWEWRGAGV